MDGIQNAINLRKEIEISGAGSGDSSRRLDRTRCATTNGGAGSGGQSPRVCSSRSRARQRAMAAHTTLRSIRAASSGGRKPGKRNDKIGCMPLPLEGKTALVTGASKGVGKGIAL